MEVELKLMESLVNFSGTTRNIPIAFDNYTRRQEPSDITLAYQQLIQPF